MKTTLHLFGILFFGALMGLEAYTKLTGEQPVAVALTIQQAPRTERPAAKPAMLPTGQSQNVSVPLLLAFQEKKVKRQPLLQQQNQFRAAAAAKMVKSTTVPLSPTTVAPEETVQLEATPVAPPAESLLASQTAPASKDSTVTAPKKKREFLGIFPVRDKG